MSLSLQVEVRRGAIVESRHRIEAAVVDAEGWPVEGYEKPEHRVQQLALGAVSDVCGVPGDEVATGTDDCGVVVFGLTLTAMARGYARLAAAQDSGEARERALHRIRNAM